MAYHLIDLTTDADMIDESHADAEPGPSIRDIDLSSYHSDGECRPDKQWEFMTRQSDEYFLQELTEEFAGSLYCINRLGFVPNFIGAPPVGYGWFRLETGTKKHEGSVCGHPNGRFYNTLSEFVEHVVCIMLGELDGCGCVLCRKPKKAEERLDPRFMARLRRDNDRRLNKDVRRSRRMLNETGWLDI